MAEDDCDMILAKDLDENTKCRICMDQGEPDSYLCIPCKCIGSISYIHVDCLKEWIKTCGCVECEICHSMYKKKWTIWAYEHNLIKSSNNPQPAQANVNVEEDDVSNWKVFLMFLFICIMFAFVAFLTAKQGYDEIGLDESVEIGFRAIVVTAIGTMMAVTVVARYHLGILIIPTD